MDHLAVHEDAPVVGGIVVVTQDRRFLGRKGPHQAAAQTVLGHVGDLEVAHGGGVEGAGGGERLPHHGEASRAHRADAGEQVQKLALAVAGNAGNADDLPARTEKLTLSTRLSPTRSTKVSPSTASTVSPAWGRRLVDPQQHLAPDHQLGQFLLAGLAGPAMGDHLAAAHDGDVIGDRHDLLQLVGDQDDGNALLAQGIENAEELNGFLRRQHAGRLIEDQDVGTAVERLQDLDALLLAHRQVAGQRIRIEPPDRSPVPGAAVRRGPRRCWR